MKPTGRALVALFIGILALAGAASQAAITASVDRDRVALGDTLRLTITATADEDLAGLDLRPITADFEILQRSSNSKTSIINGRRSSSNELLLDLTPRREGRLAIPALQLAGQATPELQVVVGPPPSGSSGDQSLVFEAELDRSSVYVQGQVILTLRLQQAINLDDRSISELKLDNAFVKPLEQQSFQRTVNGRPWLVHEIRYAIFPEQSGTLEIPAQSFSARESVPRRSLFDMGGGGRQVRRASEALTVEVLPRPDTFPGSNWLPARNIQLEETWSTPPEQLQVGESATRTITLRGDGVQGAQLPPVLYPATDGLKYYPDQPTISDSETSDGLQGLRVDSVAVVPTKAGTWQIPELRIPWWDTDSNELRYAVLPGRELVVVASGPAPLQPPAPAPLAAPALDPAGGPIPTNAPVFAGSDYWWQVAAIVNGIGWLLTLVFLFRSRRRRGKPAAPRPPESREKPAFKALLAACAGADPLLAREAVIRWGAALLPATPAVSLAEVAAACNDPAMSTALDTLNAALYSEQRASWDGTALADAARRLRQQRGTNSDGGAQELHLYPQGA